MSDFDDLIRQAAGVPPAAPPTDTAPEPVDFDGGTVGAAPAATPSFEALLIADMERAQRDRYERAFDIDRSRSHERGEQQ
jgi:hypothetical protein